MTACDVCNKEKSDIICRWFYSDYTINLPAPPNEFHGVYICRTCYCDGETMESRIRSNRGQMEKIERIVMPNRTDGLRCLTCGGFFAYVVANQENNTYLCPDHNPKRWL